MIKFCRDCKYSKTMHEQEELFCENENVIQQDSTAVAAILPVGVPCSYARDCFCELEGIFWEKK
jgi:hypothetical protein